MKFGLFGGAVAHCVSTAAASDADPNYARPVNSPASDHYRSLVDSVVQAESLGFASVFLVEHHFTGTAQISASLNVLTFLAARTTAIRLGTAVIVLPWHNPVLLAEQIATLDVLSGGRIDVGVGRGYRPVEFEHFRIPMHQAEERFEESMGLLRRSLASNQRFSHQSANWQLINIVVEPAPVQLPHPPFWIAAGRPESLQAAAAGGYNVLLDQFATFDLVLERHAVYRESVAAQGREFDPYAIAVARSLTIVGNAAERERAMQQRMAQLTMMNRLAAGSDGKNSSSMMSDPDARFAAENGTLIGTVDEVIERIGRLRDGGVEYLLLAGIIGHPAQLNRFAEEVMPSFC